MFHCRIAYPFLVPVENGSIVCHLWPLETTVIEWRNTDDEAQEKSYTQHPMHIVSFIRIGRPSLSKSKLLNEVVASKMHDTFINLDSPSGRNKRCLANGMVEMTQYLPSGKGPNAFQQELIFLNLRGDCSSFITETSALKKMSSVIVLIIELEKIDYEMEHIEASLDEKTIVLLTTKSECPKNDATVQQNLPKLQAIMKGKGCSSDYNNLLAFRGDRQKNLTEIKLDIEKKIETALQRCHSDKKSLVSHAENLQRNFGIGIDEENLPGCQDALHLATNVCAGISHSPLLAEYKKNMLPVQGDPWHQWSDLQKEKHRAKQSKEGKSFYDMKLDLDVKMEELRDQQNKLGANLSPLMKSFTREVRQLSNPDMTSFFLQWMKILLDRASRKTLPPMQQEYQRLWMEYNKHKEKSNSTGLQDIESQMFKIEMCISESALGLEHLMREFGQIYESSTIAQMTYWRILPDKVAQFLLLGIPFEIMDGDAGSVPLTWVKDVLESVRRKIGNKQLLVLSVIGIQSSGKSTFLNTMFGLEFAVSAGRCTRGIYAQLLPTAQSKYKLPFEYILVLDSEGLRAPELANEKYHRDNELATFLIGLADLTLVNLKGENTVEMRDVLQIAVHAFLRMKLADRYKKQRCIFVHQNVSAVNASEKMMQGLKKLQENLDQMTKEAAQAENVGISLFTQVIKFNAQKDVMYLSDLWSGDPPMAPVNPGYSDKVKRVRTEILQRFIQEQPRLLKISDFIRRLEDMWTAILSDNFVFSFRNTTAIKAHLSLERKCSELKYSLDEANTRELRKMSKAIEKCESLSCLETKTQEAVSHMEKFVGEILTQKQEQLEDFFNDSEYSDILSEHRQQKVYSLKNHAESILDKVQQDIRTQREQHFDALKQLDKKHYHQKAMQSTARKFAKEYRSNGKINDNAIDAHFEKIWPKIVAMEQLDINTVNVRKTMEMAVLRELSKEGDFYPILLLLRRQHKISNDLVKGITEHDIEDSQFTIPRKNVYHVLKSWMGLGEHRRQRPAVAASINNVLLSINDDLEEMCAQGEQHFFDHCEEFVQMSLRKFTNLIDFPDMNPKFELKGSILVKFLPHAIRCAILRFDTQFGELCQQGISDACCIQKEMEDILFKEFKSHGQDQYIPSFSVYLRPNLLRLEEKLQGSITLEEVKTGYVKLKPDHENDDLQNYQDWMVNIINNIMQNLDQQLDDIYKSDTKFYPVHGINFIRAVLDIFTDYNQRLELPFAFTWECQSYIAVRAASHAILKFEAMNLRYETNHGGRSRLEKYKADLRLLFVLQVKDTNTNIAAAEAFCHVMRREIQDAVMKHMYDKIKQIILQQVGLTKHDLIVKMMTTLVEKKNFSLFVSYITNAHDYAKFWIRNYAKEKIYDIPEDEEESLYQQLSSKQVEMLVAQVRECVEAIHEKLSTRWLQKFCADMSTCIYGIQQNDFETFLSFKVKDMQEVVSIILDNLNKVENDLKRAFMRLDESTLYGEKKRPDDLILDSLWGCTMQCPFCKEPCKKTDPDHTEPHECLQHRPSAVKGWRVVDTNAAALEVCTYDVAHSGHYWCHSRECACRDGDTATPDLVLEKRSHRYREYKRFWPRWDIAPDYAGDSSRYWKWFICTYKDDLAKYYGYKFFRFPLSWSRISAENAIASLNIYRG